MSIPKIITKKPLIELYNSLFDLYGPQYWWPANSQWEVCVGAILTQNTNWKNVEKAIINLRNADLLPNRGEGEDQKFLTTTAKFANSHRSTYPKKLLSKDVEEIAPLIRPSGYFNMKSERLHSIAKWWLKNSENIINSTPLPDIHSLRDSLLSVNGVGPETADTIILYAFNLPVFVIDTYTKRVCNKYLNTPIDIDYSELQKIFMDNLPNNATMFNEFHALIVQHAKQKNRGF